MADQLASLVVAIAADAQKYMQTLDQTQGKTQSWAGKIGGVATKAVGGLLVGGAVAAAGAVAAIGTAAFNVSRETEQATANIAAQLGKTIAEAERFGEVAKRVYGENFAGSVTEAGETVARAFQVMGDLGDKSLQKFTERAFALRDSFQVDTAESIDAAQTLMENFGISSDHAFDLIAKGFQKGLNRADDFTDTITEYSTQFASGGASAEQFFSLLESGLAGGMLGTDKAADAFKEFRVRIQDGAKATTDALAGLLGLPGEILDNSEAIDKGGESLRKLQEQLQLAQLRQSEFNDKTKESTRLAAKQRIYDLTGKIRDQEAAMEGLNRAQGAYVGGVEGVIDYEGGMNGFLADMASGALNAADAFQVIMGGLSNVDDLNQRMQIGVGLLGTQFEDLGDSALSLSLVGEQFANIEGAADSLNVKYQNFGDMWGALWRKTAVAVSPATDKLLEMANDAMPHVEKAFGWMEEHIPPIIDGVSGAIEKGVGFIKGLFEGPLKDGVGSGLGAFQVVRDWIDENMPLIQKTVETVVGAITRFWEANGDKIMTVVRNFMRIVQTVFNIYLRGALDIVKAIMQLITGDFEGAGEMIKRAMKRTFEGVFSIIYSTEVC